LIKYLHPAFTHRQRSPRNPAFLSGRTPGSGSERQRGGVAWVQTRFSGRTEPAFSPPRLPGQTSPFHVGNYARIRARIKENSCIWILGAHWFVPTRPPHRDPDPGAKTGIFTTAGYVWVV